MKKLHITVLVIVLLLSYCLLQFYGTSDSVPPTVSGEMTRLNTLLAEKNDELKRLNQLLKDKGIVVENSKTVPIEKLSQESRETEHRDDQQELIEEYRVLSRHNPNLKLCQRNADYFDGVKMKKAVAERARWGIGSKDLAEWEAWSNAESKHFDNMSDAHLKRSNERHRTRWMFFGPVYPLCPVPLTVFGAGDEEKRFCLPESLLTATRKQCQVLSIGGNNQWEFEIDVHSKSNCSIHTFDCTVQEPNMPEEIKDRAIFHRLCIDGQRRRGAAKNNPDAEFLTLTDLTSLTQGNQTPGSYHTLFKMDVEGYEWRVFREMVRELEEKGRDAEAVLPDQLYVELHFRTLMFELQWVDRLKTAVELYQLSEALFWNLGYILTDSRPNTVCGRCIEVLFQRVLC